MTLATVTAAELVPVETIPLDRNPAAAYLARLAPGSRRTMLGALDLIAGLLRPGATAATFDWSAVRYSHAQLVRAWLVERYSPNSVNKMLAALRGCMREAWRLGQLSAEDYHRAIDLERARGHRLPAGRALSQGEIRSLFAACAADPTVTGRRDAALLAVLYGAGVRRSEAASLLLSDYSTDVGTITIRRGKGDKDRIVHLPAGAVLALDAWVAIRGPEPGPLFLSVNKGGAIGSGGMSASAVYQRLRALAARSGVAEFSPHDLRRSCISDLLDAGADISAVKAQAGHSSVETTARYDRRGLRAQAAAASLLHVPV